MAPEFKVYVTPAAVEQFHAAIGQLDGAQIVGERPVGRDITGSDQSIRYEQLAQDLKSVLGNLPDDAMMTHLRLWNLSPKEKEERKIADFPDWNHFMSGIKHYEKAFIMKSLRVAIGVIERHKKLNYGTAETISIRDSRDIDLDWRAFGEIGGLGPKNSEFLTKVFSS